MVRHSVENSGSRGFMFAFCREFTADAPQRAPSHIACRPIKRRPNRRLLRPQALGCIDATGRAESRIRKTWPQVVRCPSSSPS